MAKLALFLPDGTPMDLPLNKERITIGRRADNDVCLPNLAVSGEHAAVVTILADSFLEDLHSSNGTLVNGKAISKHFLREGDEIDIGRHKFVYSEDDRRRMEPRLPAGLSRVAARGLGEQVEAAQPFVRGPAPVLAASAEPQPVALRPRDPDATQPAVSPHPGRERASATVTRVPERPLPAEPRVEARGWLKVLNGSQPGKLIPLTKDETTIGRAGVQVVSLIAEMGGFRLRRVEGDRPVMVNGRLLDGEAVTLVPGEVIELGDIKLELRDVGDTALRTSGT